jgi:hypothetical protein
MSDKPEPKEKDDRIAYVKDDGKTEVLVAPSSVSAAEALGWTAAGKKGAKK